MSVDSSGSIPDVFTQMRMSDAGTQPTIFTFFMFIPDKMTSVEKHSLDTFKSQEGETSKYKIYH